MKRYNKKGQFFLLAAVIISTIIISIGASANLANINPEPEDFFDSSNEVKKETNSVIDYEIFWNIPPTRDLKKFIEDLSIEIRDRDPEANFLFIYGNQSNITIENYGSKIVTALGSSGTVTTSQLTLLGGSSKISSTINTGTGLTTITGNYLSSGYKWRGSTGKITGPNPEVTIKIEGHELNFPISENIQVIFVVQKDIEDESFIAVK